MFHMVFEDVGVDHISFIAPQQLKVRGLRAESRYGWVILKQLCSKPTSRNTTSLNAQRPSSGSAGTTTTTTTTATATSSSSNSTTTTSAAAAATTTTTTSNHNNNDNSNNDNDSREALFRECGDWKGEVDASIIRIIRISISIRISSIISTNIIISIIIIIISIHIIVIVILISSSY